MKNASVVMSVSGHDKGTVYVALKREGNFLFLCDGKNKLLSKPKKKNIKHLKELGVNIDLSVYSPLYDAHIVKSLKAYKK